jgi:hypothetical protein
LDQKYLYYFLVKSGFGGFWGGQLQAFAMVWPKKCLFQGLKVTIFFFQKYFGKQFYGLTKICNIVSFFYMPGAMNHKAKFLNIYPLPRDGSVQKKNCDPNRWCSLGKGGILFSGFLSFCFLVHW